MGWLQFRVRILSLPAPHALELCPALDVAYSKGFWLVAPPADSWGLWTLIQKPLAVQGLPSSLLFFPGVPVCAGGGSQAAFWQLPAPRAVGCKERSHQRLCEFFRCPLKNERVGIRQQVTFLQGQAANMF